MNRVLFVVFAVLLSFGYVNAQISPAPVGYSCAVDVFSEAFEGGVPSGWEISTDNYTGPLRTYTNGLEGWFLHTGTTFTPGTGPTGAFEGSSYIYCEGSGPILRADTASLTSPMITLPNNPDLAMSFYTNLYGPTGSTGTFGVYIFSNGTKSSLLTPVASNTHTSASTWEQVYLDLSVYAGQSVQIMFQGIKPPIGGADVDISIDQIEICSAEPVAVPSVSTWGVIILMLLMLIVTTQAMAVKPTLVRVRS